MQEALHVCHTLDHAPLLWMAICPIGKGWVSIAEDMISYDINGKEFGSCQPHAVGKKTMLSAIPEKRQVKLGELCFVRLRYTDERGDILPLERGILSVSVQGGELIGLGSVCPYNEIGYVSDHTDTYYGEAMAAVRAGMDDDKELTGRR